MQGRINNRLSLSLPIQQNTGLSRYTYTFHNASQRRGQEGKSARRGDGLRNYECFPFSQITHFQKVKTIIQKNQTIQFPLTSKGENYNPKKSNYPIYLTSKSENYNLKNQTTQFPLTSKSENNNPKKSNYPIYLTSKSENYNLKNQTTQFPLTSKSENHNPKSKPHNYRFKGSRPTTSFVNPPMRIPARTPATSSAGA